MVRLPQEFLDRIKGQLQEEYDEFLGGYEKEGYIGLRVNTQKISTEAFMDLTPFALQRIPWTENGFYYRKEDAVTKHPHYYAGLYYVQEPSAMLPAASLAVEPGDKVLDLCAAPGGKATELSSRLKGEGLLVANDASASRAKALVKNLAAWGASNCCITAETPQKLLQQFGCFFDKILVDAPCSGEGMFRKDKALIEAWKKQGPEAYAPIQKEILDCAVRMLKPGGMLAYSTCTFSIQENENVIEEILARYPELSLSAPQMSPGFAQGEDPCGACVRIWPHRVRGEGHFLALLKKKGQSGRDEASQNERDSGREDAGSAQMPEPVKEFLANVPGELWKGKRYKQINDQCFLLPPYRLPAKIRFLRTGILAGELKRGRFEPSQALAMMLKHGDIPGTLNFSSEDERVGRYLRGETIELCADETQGLSGWTLICVDGFGLGWGKYINGSIRNKLYPGWRLQ